MASKLLPKRFSSFIVTQSLGAFNDNFYKMLIQLYILQVVMMDNPEKVIAYAGYMFTIPFVIFGPWSGYIADKYSKSTIMKVVKLAEIGVMMLGAFAFYLGDITLMMTVLFLMATQSTFFSPAKYGFIPETCQPQAVTAANGILEMSTFLFIILGTAVTGILLSLHNNNAFIVAAYCLGVAVVGFGTSLFIKGAPPAGTSEKFPWNPVSGIFRDLAYLYRQKPLWLAALANSYFWMLGIIFQTNILIYAKNMLGETSEDNIKLTLLPAFMGIGIALGSLLASRWSGKKVELGLVPLGGLGLAAAGMVLYTTYDSYYASATVLLLTGIFGGLFIVPLYAYLQFFAKPKEKGRVLATTGILNGLFLVLGTFIYWLLAVFLEIQPNTIYLIIGITTIFAVIYICTVIPEYFIRFCFWLLTHIFYRIKVVGEEHVPFHGPALLTPNHVTYIDAFILGSTMQRFIRFLMLKSFYEFPVFKWMLKIMMAIPIAPEDGRESVMKSLMRSRESLKEGHVVCIFPEGKLTRDGNMNEFRSGFETVMKDLDCPIIPVYMHNLWGSIYSFERGRPIFKIPKGFQRKITIYFGEPLPPSSTAAEVEKAVKALEAKSGKESPSKAE